MGEVGPRRRGPVALLLPYLAIAAVALAVVAGLAVRPAAAMTEQVTDYVIIAGAPGLRWEDIDPQRTPHLWRLAEGGAIGSLSVRSAHRPTCVVDGWLTLGAGNWAAGTAGPSEGPCLPRMISVETPDARGAFVPDQPLWVRHNQRELPWGAVPGTLAGSVRCTVAVGEGAAVAAARSYGGVDWYAATMPADPDRAAELMARCVLGVVDLGTVSGTGAERAAAVRRVDAAVAGVLAARPAGSVLLVAGVADTSARPRLHVAIADGPGLASGWLTSASTRRAGYLQLVDVAPTAVSVLGRPSPERTRLAGHPGYAVPGRPDDLAQAVDVLVAADQQAGRTAPVGTWFLALLAGVYLALFVALVPVLRRPARLPRSCRRVLVPAALSASALAIPVALAVGAFPWWRLDFAGLLFGAACLAGLAGAGLVLARSRLMRHTLGLVGTCAAVSAAVVAVDLVAGSPLQLNGVVGYSAPDGVRYAGVGAVGFGVLAAGTLLAGGCLAQQVRRGWRPVVVVLVGAVGVVLAGSPYLGAAPAAAMALTAGVCLAAAMCTGAWLTLSRLGWALLAGVVVTGAVALVDLWRPVDQRGGLAAFLTEVAEGTAGFALRRASLASAEALLASPLTVLAIGSGIFAWFALLRPWGGLNRLFGIYPAVRAAMMGTLVATLVAGILAGTALTVAGAAAAVAMPLIAGAALRVRRSGHAAPSRTA